MAYVCLCRGVTSREIRRQIRDGACTVDEIGRRCAAGTCCHGCHPTIEEMLDRAVPVGHVRSAIAS